MFKKNLREDLQDIIKNIEPQEARLYGILPRAEWKVDTQTFLAAREVTIVEPADKVKVSKEEFTHQITKAMLQIRHEIECYLWANIDMDIPLSKQALVFKLPMTMEESEITALGRSAVVYCEYGLQVIKDEK